MSSKKNIRKTVIRAMPSGQGYSVITPVRHSSPSASLAGASSYRDVSRRRWTRTKANAYMYECCSNDDTGPKILCHKERPVRKTHGPLSLSPDWKYSAYWGQHTKLKHLNDFGVDSPSMDPTRITKMAEMRTPIRPSYSFPALQLGLASSSGAAPPSSCRTSRRTRSTAEAILTLRS